MKDKPRTRLFVPQVGASPLALIDPESLAVRRSMRLQPGECVGCFNGDGKEYLYYIEVSNRSLLQLTLLESRPNHLDAIPETTIYIAATKGKTKDRIVKELTPLGATVIVFFQAERSISHPSGQQSERLKQIMVESCRQCGRSTIPDIIVTNNSLKGICETQNLSSQQCVLFWEETENPSPLIIKHPSEPLALFFGPEGGFTRQEITIAQEHGAAICTLGARILRSELAVLVGVTLAQAQRGLFGGREETWHGW